MTASERSCPQVFSKTAGEDKKLSYKEIIKSFDLKSGDMMSFIASGDASCMDAAGADNMLSEAEFVVALSKRVQRQMDAEIAVVGGRDSCLPM